jgi:hypothetical protein
VVTPGNATIIQGMRMAYGCGGPAVDGSSGPEGDVGAGIERDEGSWTASFLPARSLGFNTVAVTRVWY